MSTFTGNTVASGNIIYAADHNTLVAAIAAVLNGNVDSTNLADNAVTTAKITDAAVTPAKLLAGTGGTWVLQSYTPTMTNITLGNGTLTGKYIQIGKLVYGRIKLTFGTTTAMGSAPTFALPVNAITEVATGFPVGIARFFDVGTAAYIGYARCDAAGTLTPVVASATGSYSSDTGLTAAIPHSWGSTDILQLNFFYEAA